MTCRGLTEFLGENPIPRRKTKVYGTFVMLRNLLINPKDHTEKRRKYWSQPYFYGLTKILDEWSVSHYTLWNDFILRVALLLEYYCTCLPGSTVCSLLGKTSGGRLSCWAAFDSMGNLISKPWENEEEGIVVEGCSWDLTRRSIKWDALWKCPIEVVIRDSEKRNELKNACSVLRFITYDRQWKTLKFYEGSSEQTRMKYYQEEDQRRASRREFHLREEKQKCEGRAPEIEEESLTRAKTTDGETMNGRSNDEDEESDDGSIQYDV